MAKETPDFYWMGQRIEELHRDVLIEIIKQLYNELDASREKALAQLQEMTKHVQGLTKKRT